MTAKNPVLLVHGIHDTQAVFGKMARYLRDRGWVTHGIDLTPNDGTAGLDDLAQQVQHLAAQQFGPNEPFDIVAFSMGGIVSRYYLQRLGGDRQVQRCVTISSPHHGTWMARWRNAPGIQHMRLNSTFLADLNRTLKTDLASVHLTSLWTPYDLMILPASSSRLGVGHEAQFPVLAHPLMLRDDRCLAAVAAALAQPVA